MYVYVKKEKEKKTDNRHPLVWYQIINGILLPKLFWPTVRKNCSSDREKLFKTFEITTTIYSNSERSGQFFVTECFVT